ncbi:MAG: hypothetical protein WBP26_06105 [Candidatus Saccharimonadales bacterium]
MSKELSFDQKIEGLMGYYQALNAIDPDYADHDEVADPGVFYASPVGVSRGLAGARASVLANMGNHARAEYSRKGFGTVDLRGDTPLLEERADVLAVMTAPLSPEIRVERAGQIADLLGSIARGGTVIKTEYDSFHGTNKVPQEYTIDPNRALFAVFSNGHISDRNLTIQYDTPHTAPVANPGERIFSFDVPSLFAVRGRNRNPLRLAVYAGVEA